jgi:hypothetical protein
MRSLFIKSFAVLSSVYVAASLLSLTAHLTDPGLTRLNASTSRLITMNRDALRLMLSQSYLTIQKFTASVSPAEPEKDANDYPQKRRKGRTSRSVVER